MKTKFILAAIIAVLLTGCSKGTEQVIETEYTDFSFGTYAEQDESDDEEIVGAPGREVEPEIVTIGGMEYSSDITELSLHFTSLNDDDINQLKKFTKLESLTLQDCDVNTIDFIEYMPNLKSLSLRGNEITDISALSKLTDLEELDMSGNEITDISALSDMINLERLLIDNNNIADISSLSNLTNLTYLDMRFNKINDISAIEGLINLENLHMNSNSFSDITITSAIYCEEISFKLFFSTP